MNKSAIQIAFYTVHLVAYFSDTTTLIFIFFLTFNLYTESKTLLLEAVFQSLIMCVIPVNLNHVLCII